MAIYSSNSPSNTLLITDLHDLYLFQPASLASIRSLIESIAPLNSFSPLPSMRRIVCSFHSEDDALRVRKLLDGQSLLNRKVRTKIYFGEPTPLLDGGRPKLLEAPHLDKLFFISPPPSPHTAGDLAQALAQLKTEQSAPVSGPVDPGTPMSMSDEKRTGSWPVAMSGQRSRSSTLIYNPEDHGGSLGLPAVMVEDTTVEADDEDVEMMSPIDVSVKKLPPKTARPPVELMH
ncbi:putative calcineurin binding protein [Aspergillus novofumigatus IBT 16806]|uniref:Putative calcineurin binding protein n=1 Tax=Aspergillus novofumigatus (strain IBT 16806) TaxID=1392255 RepID=A0A2I1CNA9_ASPN1|nr:putative calcineurin binding protein [Aspergillus novofumigatus IBT 16806]PKX99111.1 putative calcineurin binding protein [Aspergillus novofumigatus IBT 16806]